MKIEPKQLAPGFFKRLLVNGYDLLLRHPIFWCIYGCSLISIGYLFTQIKNPEVFLVVWCWTIGLIMVFFGTFVAFQSDREKLTLSNYWDLLKESFTCFMEYITINRLYYGASFILFCSLLLIISYYAQGVDRSIFDKTLLHAHTILFGIATIFFSDIRKLSFYNFILQTMIDEPSLKNKRQIISNLIEDAYNKNFDFGSATNFIPALFMSLSFLNMFFAPIILFLFLPMFIYLSFREIFLDIDKNQKVTEKETKTAFNLA